MPRIEPSVWVSGECMKQCRLILKILQILIKDRLYYPGRFLVDAIALVARCGVLLLLYAYVFDIQGGGIGGTTFLVVAWSIFFYFAFSVLRLRDIARAVMEDVQSGNVEILLSKPIAYLSYKMWWQFGSGFPSFLLLTTVGTLVLTALLGFPSTMAENIFLPTLGVVFVLGTILSLTMYLIVGLLAFWIEDITPIFWIIDKGVMILGGSYLPISLFHPVMYKLAVYSPFGASQLITHTVTEAWKIQWLEQLGIQLFWILVLALVMYVLFARARRKVSVNGG